MRNKTAPVIMFAALLLSVLLLPFSGKVFAAESRESLGEREFSAADRCYFGGYENFAIRISGKIRGNYVYINKMQYMLNINFTGGRSQFRLRVPDAKIIPKRFTSDINWWGDRRRDDWWSKKRWTTFWKRSYKQGKMSVRGSEWVGKFRADLSGSIDRECIFRIPI